MRVRDLMTESPLTASPSTKVGDAAELLMQNDIRHLPICEGGALVGMISDRDLRALVTPVVLEEIGLNELKARYDSPVSELMVPDVVTVHPESTIQETIEPMLEHKIGAVPVVDPGSGELLGIVSYIDVLRAVRDQLSE